MSDDQTMMEMIRDLWHGKRYVVAGTLVGAVLALLLVAGAVPHYKTAMIVAPVPGAGGVDLGAAMPDNTGLAVQYLVNRLGSRDSTAFIYFETMLRGARVADKLRDDELVRRGVAGARLFSFLPARPVPDNAASLSDFLTRHVKIVPVGHSAMRRIYITHPDPAFGVYLLEKLHHHADAMVKTDVAGKAENRSRYLQEQLGRTHHPDHRKALTSLLMEQEHIMMMLAIDEPYAAIMPEPPVTHVRPDWPRPGFLLPLFMLVGAAAGYVVFAARRAALAR